MEPAEAPETSVDVPERSTRSEWPWFIGYAAAAGVVVGATFGLLSSVALDGQEESLLEAAKNEKTMRHQILTYTGSARWNAQAANVVFAFAGVTGAIFGGVILLSDSDDDLVTIAPWGDGRGATVRVGF